MNLQTPYRYPLDKTGVDPSNLVVDELHDLPNLAVRCVAPTYGGFYTEGVIIRDYVTGEELVYDVDYKFGEILELPSDRYCKEICGYIVIFNTRVSKITITYQALGGEYSYSMDSIIEMLNSLDLGNRPVEWGLIVGKPVEFPPVSHMHPSSDIYGMEYVVHSLERVRQAILMGDVASHDEIYAYIDRTSDEIDARIQVVRSELNAHMADKNNPHNTTKAQVGLGSVENYAIATQAEAVAGTVNVKYMTPLRVMESINNKLIPVNEHIASRANPHGVTKAQVGLDVVENFTISSKAEAEAGAASNRYMTPLRVKEAIDALIGVELDAHVNDKNNPHAVTKAQVGLGSVQNYGIATANDATSGASNILYMTPLRVKEAITLQAVTPLNNHVNNVANPHNTTKAQVGLDAVQNYGVATQAEAQAGTSDIKYTTPIRVKQAIDTFAVAPLNAHIGNTANPHNTTKAQVGLGSVENYGIATLAEALSGTTDDKYVTPLKVKHVVDNLAVAPLNAHVGNTNNPHNTTKAQVGLAAVQNYGIAEQVDATTGTSNILYMTPLRVKQAVDTFAGALLNTHISNTNNPHGVTAAQVGLGAVANYGIATTAEAQAGTSDSKYTTPLKVKQAIDTFAVAPLNSHTGNTNNPHGVTKSQVGLSAVQNYGVAATADATAGTSNMVYMTPVRVKEAIDAFSVGPLNAHIGNTNNPHNTTKAQVGLGSVDNFPTASQAEAQAGAATDRFMTPIRVKQAIDRFAITSPNFTTNVTSTGAFYAYNAFAFNNPGEGGSDTGFWWESDGVVQIRSDSVTIARYTPTEFRVYGNLVAEGAAAAMGQGNVVGSLRVHTSGGGDANTAGLVMSANGYVSKLALRNDGILGFGGGNHAAWRWYVDANGNTTAAGDVTAYSDPLLKEAFEEIKDPEAILDQLDGCIFRWKSGISENIGREGKRDYGILADQVEAILPEFIHYSKASGTSYRTVAYHKFVPIIIEAHKAYKARSEARFEMMEKQIRDLSQQVAGATARF